MFSRIADSGSLAGLDQTLSARLPGFLLRWELAHRRGHGIAHDRVVSVKAMP